METKEKEELSKILETLTTKIDELADTIKDKKVTTKDNMKETSKEDIEIFEKLTKKIDELTNIVKEKKIVTEDKIKENPLAYTIGAFVGGLFVGLLMRKREEGKE